MPRKAHSKSHRTLQKTLPSGLTGSGRIALAAVAALLAPLAAIQLERWGRTALFAVTAVCFIATRARDLNASQLEVHNPLALAL